MVLNITIHCDCGIDIDATPSDSTVACPNCEMTFTVSIIELPTTSDLDYDASNSHNGTRTYLGP